MEEETQEKSQDIQEDAAEDRAESGRKTVLEGIKQAIEQVSDSSVYISIFANNIISENKGVVTGDNAQIDDLQFLNHNNETLGKVGYSDEENLSGEKTTAELAQWIQTHYGKFELAELISLAVFYDMPYLWVHTNAKALFHKLGWDLQEEVFVTAKDSLLCEFSAFTYKGYIVANGGKTETEFVAFKDAEMAKFVLEYVWAQYIDIRIPLIVWGEWYTCRANYSQARAAVCAMAVWAQCDYGYFDTKILSGLIRKENIVTVAELVSLIAQNELLEENIRRKVVHWGTLQSYEYVMLALMVAHKNEWDVERIIKNYFSQLMWEVENSRKWEYTSQIVLMYAIGQRKANYYKAIVKALASYNAPKNNWLQTRKILALVFYMLLKSDMELLRAGRNEEKELILVRMLFIRNEYREPLCELWKNALRNNLVRNEIRKMMKEYWNDKVAKDIKEKVKMQDFYKKVLAD